MLKANLRRDPGGGLFMGGIPIAMEKHDGHAVQPLLMGRHQVAAQDVLAQGHDNLTVGADALACLHHRCVQHLGKLDIQGKNIRAVLISYSQRIGQTCRRDQHGGIALAFQQRIGGHCGTHLDGFDGGRLPAEQGADSGHGCVIVSARILR